MTYTVIDTLTNEPFPASTLQDVQSAVEYIISGQELSSYEDDRLTEFFYNVAEYGSAFSRILGLEVVSHD